MTEPLRLHSFRPLSAADVRAAARAGTADALPDAPSPNAGPGTAWLYVRGQYELGLLDRLVDDGFAANKHVHYARNYGLIHHQALFRTALCGAEGTMILRSNDTLACVVDGELASTARTAEGDYSVRLPAGSRRLLVKVQAREGQPATFAALDGHLLPPAARWEAQTGHRNGADEAQHWSPAVERPGGAGVPPHLENAPVAEVRPHPAGSGGDWNLFSLSAPVLGRPVVSCEGVPGISTGESVEEALSPDADGESRRDVVQLADGRWTTVHELGFRHVVVRGATVHDVTVEASAHPVPRRGAFVCSDEKINRIWDVSAYTLRLCMNGLMLDGIKRDRMPWMGDQALNTLSNAYAFADAGIVRDGLVALGQPRHGFINGISDYSLWWLINTASYGRFFGDAEYVAREKHQIHRFTEYLAGHCGKDGIFRPGDEPDSFADSSDGGVFIDWGVSIEPGRTFTPLQVLWFWALRSAADVLAQAGHEGSRRWAALAETLRETLMEHAWDEDAQGWREYFDGDSISSPYANMLAVLSGLSQGRPGAGVRASLLGTHRAGTPFMTSFALRALAMTGEAETAVARVRELWGGMLDAGARSFWEEFASPGEGSYEMYGRPFGKSLCHAWSSGPAALLPQIVLGAEPTEDGWAEFRDRPALGSLAWAAAVIPVPQGEITIHADPAVTHVDVPAGTTLAMAGHRAAGPCLVTHCVTTGGWTIHPSGSVA
jgi:hypothetical protein